MAELDAVSEVRQGAPELLTFYRFGDEQAVFGQLRAVGSSHRAVGGRQWDQAVDRQPEFGIVA
jgi:hypothetical protein